MPLDHYKKDTRGVHILLRASPVNGRSAEEFAQIAVEWGASVVQLREKEMPMDELLPIAKKMRAICRDITFIVNDRTDLAKIIEADGVHLGQDDLPINYAREILGEKVIIGISCGSLQEALIAEKEGANYVGFGHMYPTTSKKKFMPPKSLQELEKVCAAVSIPVVAIGGITVNNLPPLLTCGIEGIAVISAFSHADYPRSVLQEFTKSFISQQ
jgi:thiamine-phosphate pyrophosphorylase